MKICVCDPRYIAKLTYVKLFLYRILNIRINLVCFHCLLNLFETGSSNSLNIMLWRENMESSTNTSTTYMKIIDILGRNHLLYIHRCPFKVICMCLAFLESIFWVNVEHRQPGRLTVGDFKCRQKDRQCFMMALKAWVF